MLRGAPVVDGEHRPTGRRDEGAAEPVVRLKVTEHPATTVQVEHDRRAGARTVQAHGHTVGIQVGDVRDTAPGFRKRRSACLGAAGVHLSKPESGGVDTGLRRLGGKELQ
jgi:hypothetical protein